VEMACETYMVGASIPETFTESQRHKLRVMNSQMEILFADKYIPPVQDWEVRYGEKGNEVETVDQVIKHIFDFLSRGSKN